MIRNEISREVYLKKSLKLILGIKAIFELCMQKISTRKWLFRKHRQRFKRIYIK